MTDPTDRDRAQAMIAEFEAFLVDTGREKLKYRATFLGVATEHMTKARAEGRRAAFEEAAAKADAERDEYEALIAAGKGQWQRPGYVPDDMWTKFLAVAACSRRLGDALRALAAKEQP